MALDPLKFQVAIKDDATGQLKKIEQEFDKLKDKTISVKVEGLSDLQQLLSALQHQQVSNLGKDVGSAINDAAKNLQKEAQEAIRTSLGNLAKDLVSVKEAIKSDSFSAFSQRIETCAEKITLLDEAFKKFKVTIGENKELKDLLTGWGAAIKEVSAAMAAMNSVKNGGGAKAAPKEDLKQQEEGLIKVANAMGRVRDAASGIGGASASGVGFMESINKVGERNIQTLIKEQGHIERLIAIAKKSIDFGEGHPVLGMGRLRGDQMQNLQNLEQLKNIIKEILFAANQGDQAAIRFLNTLGSLKTIPFGKDFAGNDITLLGGHFDKLTHSVTGTATAMRQLNKDMRLDFNKAANKEKLAAEAEAVKKLAASYKSMQQESKTMRSQSESALASRIKMLREQSADLQKLLSVGKIGLGEVQYNSVRDALREIRKELQQIETITQRGGNSTGLLRSLSVGRDYSGVIASGRAVADMRNKQAQETNLASRAVSQLTMEEQRLAQALNQATNSARGQSQVLSDLKSLATQYLGVWGAQGFLRNVIEIGGQLEMQRLSIGAILQNQAQANDLFNKIKGLATQSPFGVVELDQMTKQLTAYGFKYNELYDMTKRLADISAATGTGVDRLALALGHVRSEAALSGYTLRQFAMGNVPMLQKLSEKLGKSTEEIRKMVRSKQISYDDVVGVLKDLTDEGGMFYNMQEVISQSVKAKFKNVRDAMDIMYGEMAEGSIGDALKEVADVLMDVTRNWKDVATVVGSVTGVWVTHRAAILAMNAALGSNTASVTANILSYKQKRAIELQNEALTRKLTAEELALVATRKTITAENIRVAMSTNAITKGEALRLVGLRKLSLEEAKALIRSGEFTAAEVRMAMQGRVLGMNLGYAGNMMRYLVTSAKMMMAALLTNPWTWIMAGVTTVIELWQRNSREMEQAEELSNKIYEHSQEALKNTRQMLQDTGIKVEWRNKDKDSFSDVTSNFGRQLGGQIRFSLPEFDTSNAKESIERWTQYIRDYAATPNRLLNEALFDEAGNVRALKDQFDNLKVAVEEVAVAQEQLRSLGDIFENAVNATNSGWFDDSVLTNISDYDKTLRSFGNNIATTYKKFRVNIDIALQSARQQDSEFDKAASGMATYAQQLDLLVRNQEKYAKASEVFRNANTISRAAMNELSGDHIVGDAGAANVEAQKATMMADLETFYVQLQADLETKGIKIGSMSEAQQQALLLGYKDKLSSIQGLSEETANFLMKEFAKRFGIEIDVDDEKFRVKEKEIIRILKELSESDWNVEMNFATNVKDVIDEAQKQYKAAKEYFEKVKPIMLKLGVEFEAGKMLTDEQIEAAVAKADPKARDFIRQALKGVNEATKVYNNAMNASKAGGFSLEDNKKKKTPGERKSEDKDARRLREIVKLYKDAYDWYGKYEKQVGEGSALEKVKEQFEPLFKQFEEQFKQKLSLDSIPLYKENLVSLLDEAQKLYESPKHKNSYMVETIKTIRDAINNVDYEEAQRKMDEYASRVQTELDGLTRAWDVFNNVREATGNIDLAIQLSGADYQAGQTRNLADALREKIEKDFASANAVTIPFDINMSDKDIENKIKAAIPKESEERIKGIVEEYKKWRDLQRDLYKNDISVFTKAWNDDRNRYEQFNKAVARYEKEKQSLERLLDQWNSGEVDEFGNRKGISQAQFDRAFANLTSRENWAKFKAQTGMDWITSNIDNTSIATVRRMIIALKEYAATTQMSAEETEAWFKAINMFTDREAVISPIQGVTQAIENYNRAAERRIAAEASYKNTKANENATSQQIAEASQEYDEAVAEEIAAFNSLKKAINVLSTKFTQFGSDLQNFGQQLGGTVGDILGGFGQIFTSVGNGMNAIQNINLGATGISKILGYAQTTIGVVGSMIGLFQGVSSLFPTTDSLYEHYAAKQRKLNQLREAVDNYRIAVARANAEEKGWIGGGDALDNLRKAYDVHGEVVLAYYSKLQEAQEQYVESSAGIKKAIIPMIAAITAVAAVAAGVFSGGTGTVALWGLGTMAMNALGASAIAATLSATTLAAIGAAVAATAGAVVGQAVQSGIDAITYKEGQIDARRNMRVQTQHHTFFRSEKTQNLEEWAKENLGVDLFDKSGLIDLKAAQAVLDSGATLVGETKETLEKLMDLREQYDEWEKSIRDYVSDRFGGIADDMVNAVWDWLSEGENALDKFHEYASDTFRQIAQDAVKSFLKVTVLDKFQEQLENMYKAYSMKDKNGNRVLSEEGLMLGVASLAGDMASAFETALPMAENLATIIKDAFDIQGYDITNQDSSSSSAGKSIQSITEQTADLLASYVNSIRADVSVNRAMIAQYFPMYYQALTSGNDILRGIENHTAAIMRSNEAIEKSNQAILDRIDGLRNNTWRVPMA